MILMRWVNLKRKGGNWIKSQDYDCPIWMRKAKNSFHRISDLANTYTTGATGVVVSVVPRRDRVLL